MNAVVRRRLEMAARVRDFLRTRGADGFGDAPALVKLEALLERGRVLVSQQRGGLQSVRAAALQRAGIRHAVQAKLLPYLFAVGAVATRDNLALAPHLQMPRQLSHLAFLGAVRNMVEKATAQKGQLIQQGMPSALLDDLSAALDQFEKTLEASRAGRRDHVGASADLKAISVEIVEQVRLLDGIVRYRFGDNAELMGTWLSARNVLGPFRSKTQQTPGGEASAGPDVVKPAA